MTVALVAVFVVFPLILFFRQVEIVETKDRYDNAGHRLRNVRRGLIGVERGAVERIALEFGIEGFFDLRRRTGRADDEVVRLDLNARKALTLQV